MNYKIALMVINYANKNYYFTKEELENIKYSFLTILSEFEKLFLIFIFFSLLGKTNEFLVSVIVLFLIRSFSGGLHFDTFWGCFLFTLTFFILSILVLPEFNISRTFKIVLLLMSAIINYALSPMPSKHRPKYDENKMLKFKIISTIFILCYSLLFILQKNNPIFNYTVWIVILQSFQLILAKGAIVYEKQKEQIFKRNI